MASIIKLKRSSTAGATPSLSDLQVGELAINTKDQKIYSSNGTGIFQVHVDNSLLSAKIDTTTFKATLANTNAFIAAEAATVEGGSF